MIDSQHEPAEPLMESALIVSLGVTFQHNLSGPGRQVYGQAENPMHIIEAPNQWDTSQATTPAPMLFLAGGISGCPDWQQDLIAMLKEAPAPLVLFNPRRANFPMRDPTAAREQITWEHTHLRLAQAISFWFPRETLNPITLYELGAWSMTPKQLFIGVHPGYQRRQDVEIQTALARPDIQIVYALEALAEHINAWLTNRP
jgi:hypothetical protein